MRSIDLKIDRLIFTFRIFTDFFFFWGGGISLHGITSNFEGIFAGIKLK